MGAGTTCAGIAVVCCFMFLPLVLQTVGMFTPMWASNSTCDSIGIVYSCCTGSDNKTCGITNGGNELDVRVLGLEATSFVVMFLAVFCSCIGVCCNSDDEDKLGWCQLLGGCCFMCYPVAGLFSVIGCIIAATKFPTSALGYSFALCLTSGCIVILITIVLCYCLCKAAGQDDDVPATLTSQPSTGGMAPYDPAPHGRYGIQHTTIDHAVVMHDEESGSVLVFMRRMNIARLVGSFRQ